MSIIKINNIVIKNNINIVIKILSNTIIYQKNNVYINNSGSLEHRILYKLSVFWVGIVA